MYSTSCSTTPSDNCALPLIKIAKSDTQMVSWATRCGLWPLIHQHLCFFFRGGEKILLIAETFCVVSLQGLCTACTHNDSHKASLIYLNRKYAVVVGQWNSIAQKMRKPVNCFWGQESAEKNCVQESRKKLLRENFNVHSWSEPIFFRWYFRTSRNKLMRIDEENKGKILLKGILQGVSEKFSVRI